MKKTITLALVTAAALALVAGGVGATEIGTQDEQPTETTDAPEEEEYDEKLTAEESVAMNLDDEDVDVEVVDDTEYDEKLTAEESVAMNLDDEDVDIEVVDDTEYDEKLTAEESVAMNLDDEDVDIEMVDEESGTADA